jgi:hypothetical protein
MPGKNINSSSKASTLNKSGINQSSAKINQGPVPSHKRVDVNKSRMMK